jgi:hypothetical protein
MRRITFMPGTYCTDNEILEILDDADRVIGQTTRKGIHRKEMLDRSSMCLCSILPNR